MDKRSKFTYEPFTGDYPIVVSKQRYTEKEAISIAKYELGVENVEKDDRYVYYGFGVNEDGEKYNGWWLTDVKGKRSCPVWAFKERENNA